MSHAHRPRQIVSLRSFGSLFLAIRAILFLVFLVRKYILQLYCNEFVIQRLAAAHYDSACIKKSIMHLLAGLGRHLLRACDPHSLH